MIYYVEDDENIRELVAYTLTQMGLSTKGFGDAASFYDALKTHTPQLVLLDIMLPGEDGLCILRTLRQTEQTKELPILMVTAKGTETDKVSGLELGADDYIAKPFGMAELVARVRAKLRRAGGLEKERSVLRSGGLVLNTEAHTVQADGEELSLSLKEYELLRVLMEARGAVLSREELLDRIWQYAYVGGTRTVDVHVQSLRTKLKEYGSRIETVRGVGYRFGG